MCMRKEIQRHRSWSYVDRLFPRALPWPCAWNPNNEVLIPEWDEVTSSFPGESAFKLGAFLEINVTAGRWHMSDDEHMLIFKYMSMAKCWSVTGSLCFRRQKRIFFFFFFFFPESYFAATWCWNNLPLHEFLLFPVLTRIDMFCVSYC